MEQVKVKHFWTWFRKQSRSFPPFPERSDEKVDRFIQKLLSQLDGPEGDLQLQMTWNATDGSCLTLYFTTHGDVNRFGEIERLVARAPSIPGWTFIALSPPWPMEYLQHIEFDAVNFDPFNCWFNPIMGLDHNGKITVVAYMEMYIDNIELYEQVMCTTVFSLLGEKWYGVKVGDVVTKNLFQLSKEKRASLVNIQHLPEYFKTSEIRSIAFPVRRID